LLLVAELLVVVVQVVDVLTGIVFHVLALLERVRNEELSRVGHVAPRLAGDDPSLSLLAACHAGADADGGLL
jgi:hypothetical protein